MLHHRNTVRDSLHHEIALASNADEALPKYRMHDEEHDPQFVQKVIVDELRQDGNSQLNLATFCQTWAEPEIREIMSLTLDKNMIDKDEYPETAEIESRCVHILAELWNSPDAMNTLGTSTTGSSEAAMLGGMALLWKWRARQRALGKPTDRPNIVTGPVQVCWHKFARYWDVELREIPMQGDRLIMTPAEVISRVDENTIGVVPTLGVTFTCQYEPVAAVAEALDELQAATGLDVHMHVDAASGGFIAPFCEPDLEWDFRIPRVKSINSSGHKFGLAPLGVGWIIWRDVEDLPEELIFNVNYLGGNMPTFALNFSRPGGQIIAQYYNFLRLGRAGYRKVHQAGYETAQYLAAAIAEMGPFELIYDGGPGGIPGLAWKLKDGESFPFTLFDLADELRVSGWQVPAYFLPPEREDLAIQRILVRQDFTKQLADQLLSDYRRAVSTLQRRTMPTQPRVAPAVAFRH
jgi:glutamate decarboxylase